MFAPIATPVSTTSQINQIHPLIASTTLFANYVFSPQQCSLRHTQSDAERIRCKIIATYMQVHLHRYCVFNPPRCTIHDMLSEKSICKGQYHCQYVMRSSQTAPRPDTPRVAEAVQSRAPQQSFEKASARAVTVQAH